MTNNLTSLVPVEASSPTAFLKLGAIAPAPAGISGQSSLQTLMDGLQSRNTTDLISRVAALRNLPSPALMPLAIMGACTPKTLEEQLFDATAKIKILTSQVAMHLDRAWRNRLFQQLDSLHDPDEWDPADEPVKESSFATFLKAICQIRPSVRPGLGVTHHGRLIAAWTVGKNRLTIEFLPGDRVRWVISRYPDGELEQFAGQTTVVRLLDSLAPHAPEEWFFNAR